MTWRYHNECLDDLTADRIWAAHDRSFGNGGMFEQGSVHFKWADAVRGRQDHVVSPYDQLLDIHP
jgi:hypothetical protein